MVTTLLAPIATLAHTFQVCNNDNLLGVDSIHLTPDPPLTGENLTVTLEGTTQQEIGTDTTLELSLHSLGIPLAQETFNFCRDFGLSCPMASNTSYHAALSYPIPSEVPSGLTVKAEIQTSPASLGCFTLSTKLASEYAICSDAHLHSRFLFEKWNAQHDNSFRTLEEYTDSLVRFGQVTERIEAHNAENQDFKLGHNQFSLLTSEEYQKTLLPSEMGRYHESVMASPLSPVDSTLPTSLDWRSQGAVTPVKNQGQCGSCWAFSTTGSLEGAYAIKTGSLVTFSEQELVSCDQTDNGCGGGEMDNAFAWISKHQGLCRESDYPYTSASGTGGSCSLNCDPVEGSQVVKWVDVNTTEAALMEALQVGPVSVAIEADKFSFQLYSHGVYTATCGTNLDHGVLAVGYGTEDGKDYWLVKNSWASTWGDEGYIKMARGLKQTGGQCGILLSASYPIV